MKVRSQTFCGTDTWQAACEFAQEKLEEGYTTVLLITGESALAKKYDVPEGTAMIRYWGKPKEPKLADIKAKTGKPSSASENRRS